MNLLKVKIRKEHKKIFCGPSKNFTNISWTINIWLKYFITPAKTLQLAPTYLMYSPSSTEKLTTPITTDNSLSLSIKWYKDANFCLIFKGSCLRQKNATFTPLNRIHFFIVYKLNTWSRNLNFDFTLKDCLFGGVKQAENVDPDKYLYSSYGNGSIRVQNFHYLTVAWIKMLLVLVLIWAFLCTLIRKIKIS